MRCSIILKNIIYKFSLEILRIFIPIISVPYIYRIFKPEIMGNIEFSQSITGYFFIFAGFGVYTYGLREVSRVRNDEKKKNKLFTELFLISTISSILITVIYLLYIFFKFDNILLKKILLINSIQLISYIFYIEWINEAFEDYNFISKKTIIVKLLNVVCIFLFIKISNDFNKYLYIINIFIFINNFISFIYIRKYIKFDFKNLKLKKYLLPLSLLVLISNINVLYTRLDRIFLGFYGNIEEVAYYGVAQKVMSIFMVIIMSIINVTIPRLSFYLGQNQKYEYENLFNKIFPFVYLLLFPIGIGIIILSKEISLFFGGTAYLPAQAVVTIFGMRMIVVTIESLLSNHVIFLNKKEKVIAIIIGIFGILNLLTKYFLIKFNCFNAASAIFTTMIAEILTVNFYYWYIKKYLKLNLKIFKIENFKYLFFSLLFFPIGYTLRKFNFHYIVYSVIVFIFSAGIYLIILLMIKDKCIKEILEKININKFFSKWKNQS
ncbi:oligosaccharide flippase family protein [Fusobacterium varium]|uniref:oligosaccharide flippase family protein n=1 Tax=Fusobacterium varium TaxID=856 RepID=UPI003563AAE8